MSVAALVVAAGRGERLGQTIPKAFVPLLGKPLLVRSLEAMAAVAELQRVVVVVPPDELERFAALELPGPVEAVPGGAERQDSVAAGLAALPASIEWVAVHDAARALVAPRDVTRAIAAARETGAALLAVPARDTIKRVRDGAVVETPARDHCWAAQTPQVFRAELLREALAAARAEGLVATDDAQLVERLGVTVRVVEGDPRNIKITLPEDLATAEAWLRAAQ
jgi:2-C-methyl-D-erythritol 4-phosphate cytidylyltransferase